MASACLVGLPNEIIGHICAMLCCNSINYTISEPRQKNTELYNLSLTCKALCALAQSALYQHVRLARYIPLLRTLIARPDLASMVRTFSSYSNGLGDDDDASGFGEAEFSTVETAAARLKITLPEGWRSETWDTISACVFDILLGHLTGIETLAYTCGFEVIPAKLLSKSRIVLPSLQRLYINYWDSEGGFDLDTYGKEFFKIAPNLEFLRAHMCLAVSSDLSLGKVKSLHFEESFLTGNDIERIVRACPLLERFSVEIGGSRVSQDISGDEFTPGDVMRALRTRKQTLKQLDLHLNYMCDEYLEFNDPPPTGQDGVFGSFAEFSKLEKLIVLTEYLSDNDEEDENGIYMTGLPSMLPESLEFLGLVENGDLYVEELVGAIGRGQLPQLKTVAMTRGEKTYEELKNVFNAVGVEYVIYDRNTHSLYPTD